MDTLFIWSYWPDLNRRPIVTPKKCAAGGPSGGCAFFWGPRNLIFDLADSNFAHNSKQKSTHQGAFLFVFGVRKSCALIVSTS